MATFELISYDGYVFANTSIHAGLPWSDSRGQWTVNPQFMSRLNQPGILTGGEITPRTIAATLSYIGTDADVIGAIDTLLGQLQPDNTEARVLVMSRNGVLMQNYAVVQLSQMTEDDPYALPLRFICARPTWEKITPTTYGPVTWPGVTNNAVLAVPNAGKARANLDLTIAPTSLDTSVDVFGSRRTFTVTNNGDTTLRRFPFEVSFGDSSGWMPADSTKLWLYLDGVAQARTLIAPGEVKSYMWMLIDELAPAASFTYDLVWDGATNATELQGSNAPAFDITWEKATASTGDANGFTKDTANWRSNQWARGEAYILSGSGSGQTRKILSNSATQIVTEGGVFSPVPANGSVFLLTMSHNDRWISDVKLNERNNSNRGLWWINRGQTRPSQVVFDQPGGWFRYLFLDNNDEKNQARWTPIDVGGGDIDYFAVLDADRTAQGWTSLQEEGQADGIAFSSQIPIVGFLFNYALKNPNAICKAFFGARESGAEDWENLLEDSTASDGLVNSAVQDFTFAEDMRHLVAALLPINEAEIPVSWKRDTGSRTGGGSTTLQDNTKEWATDQWVNGSVRIVGGTGSGQVRTVSSNTSILLTVSSAWTTLPSDDSRFEVRNKTLVATLRCQSRWEVRLNTTKVTHGAISSTISPNYNIDLALALGGGPDLTVPYQSVRLGMDGRRIFIAGTEEIRIDGQAQRAAIYTTASGAKVKDVSAATRVMERAADGNSYLAQDWLLLPPTPTNPITNPDFLSNITDWAQYVANTSGVTCTPAWSSGVGHLANGSLIMDITASSAAAGATVQWATPTVPPYFPVVAGRGYTVTAWGRRLNANWRPKLGIAWYDSGDALIGSASIAGSIALDYVHTNTTFLQIGHYAVAPTNAASARVVVVSWEVTSSTTGQVWFDEVRWDTDALFMRAQGQGIGSTLEAELTEAWYG